jgi:tripartite-type tricarboxylate transporter receptor subunit TctC
MMRSVTAALAGLALAASSIAGAAAEPYPNRAVRILVGFAAGGGSDTATRLFAVKLGALWGQQILVENRGGAGGILAAELVARAPPDGYTLLNCGISHVLRPLLYKQLNFDPLRDFAPISPIATFANMLVVPPASPFKTLGDFLAFARANPGRLHYGSSGVGGSMHLTMELFKSQAGIDVVHVPYKGGGPAFADLIAGQIDVTFDNTTTMAGPVKAGQVRALAVSSPVRWPTLPDVPTAAEAGVPGFDVVAFYGLCAPAGVPEPILDKLSADTLAVLRSPDLAQRFAEQAIVPAPMSRAQFTGFLASETATWSKVLKDAGVQPEQ